MPGVFNQFQQLAGMTLSDWRGVPFPQAQQITGRYCKLKCTNAERHAKELYEAYCEAGDCRDWTYPAVRPFKTFDAFLIYLKNMEEQTDPMYFAVIGLTGMKPVGMFALMRTDPANGVIEVGHVSYSVCMKRARILTEVTSLLLKYVFEDLGCRRFEWKCDAFNAPSREVVKCSGLSFGGTFCQAIVTRGRNRDTAWYPIIDGEYLTLRSAHDLRFDKGNFNSQGR